MYDKMANPNVDVFEPFYFDSEISCSFTSLNVFQFIFFPFEIKIDFNNSSHDYLLAKVAKTARPS